MGALYFYKSLFSTILFFVAGLSLLVAFVFFAGWTGLLAISITISALLFWLYKP